MAEILTWETDQELRLILVAMVFTQIGHDAINGEVVEMAQEFFNFIQGAAEPVKLREVKAGV